MRVGADANTTEPIEFSDLSVGDVIEYNGEHYRFVLEEDSYDSVPVGRRYQRPDGSWCQRGHVDSDDKQLGPPTHPFGKVTCNAPKTLLDASAIVVTLIIVEIT
jgi:hypothetical protein